MLPTFRRDEREEDLTPLSAGARVYTRCNNESSWDGHVLDVLRRNTAAQEVKSRMVDWYGGGGVAVLHASEKPNPDAVAD